MNVVPRRLCRWRGILSIAALGALTGSCREDPAERCLRWLEAGRFQAVVQVCGSLYEETRDPAVALAVAKAQKELGDASGALGWSERLQGTNVETEFLELAALIRHEQGDSAEAARLYRRLSEIYAAEGNAVRLAEAYHRLFYTAWEQSLYREALAYAQNAVRIAMGAGEREMKVKTLQGLWTILYVTGDLDSATAVLDELDALIPADRGQERAYQLASRGAVLIDQGRFHLARDACERSLEQSQGIEDPRFFRSVHLNLADIYTELRDFRNARIHLDEAWRHAEPGAQRQTALLYHEARLDAAQGLHEEAAESIAKALESEPVPEWAWVLEYERGRNAEQRGRTDVAEEAYRKSTAIVESMRAELGVDELKSHLLDRKRWPYESLFRLLAEAGRPEDALEVMERAKARTFLDAFVKAASRPAESGESLLAADLSERIDVLRRLLPRMQGSPIAQTIAPERLLPEVGRLSVLAYFEAESHVWLVTVLGGELRIRRLAPTAASLAAMVAAFENNPNDETLAARLGEALLPPGSLPEKGKSLHIVTDGDTGRVPFAALRYENEYLIERHVLTFVPSLNALAALARLAGDEAVSPPVVLADSLGDLPGAALEADDLKGRLGARVYAGEKATRKILLESARARLLHLATHSGVGLRGAWVRLSDGTFTATDVVEQGVGPRLVVLASCSSAARTARGMWGSLGAAFLAAGSLAAVATLRSVEDEAARRFVASFYEHGGASSSAPGVARAQRALIRRGEPPEAWAPFVHLGIGDELD